MMAGEREEINCGIENLARTSFLFLSASEQIQKINKRRAIAVC
jgi:hypothetical protein